MGFDPSPEKKGQERVRHCFKVHAESRKTCHASGQRKAQLYVTAAVQNLLTVEICYGIITVWDTQSMGKALLACPVYRSFSTTNKGCLHAHLRACSRRRELKRARDGKVCAKAELQWINSHARCRLWRFQHNNRCEIYDDEFNLLLGSYYNTAWRLACLRTPLSATAEGL